MLCFFRVHWLGRLATVVNQGAASFPSLPLCCRSVHAARCWAGTGKWVRWKSVWVFGGRVDLFFVCLFVGRLIFSPGDSWSKSLCGLVNFCGRTKAGMGVHRWGWKAEEGGNILVPDLIYISFKWPWNHIRLYTGKKKKKVQDMSTIEMLKHLVRSTNEVSPPFPGVTATKGSAAGLVILKEQELLCSISRSSYHVLH